ncbi:MAG: type II toxin-antitoxin system RelE/ParE family toxin [Terriglobales bacterium]
MKIEWHPAARADLAELVQYIADDDPAAAYRVLDKIRNQINTLATHPRIGRAGRVIGTRELVISGTPYIAAYRIFGDVLTVLRLLHGARLWPPKL